MRFPCTLTQTGNSGWVARHSSRDLGNVEARGATREEAVAKLEGEIRYHLELCPCTGETYRHIDVEIIAEA